MVKRIIAISKGIKKLRIEKGYSSYEILLGIMRFLEYNIDVWKKAQILPFVPFYAY